VFHAYGYMNDVFDYNVQDRKVADAQDNRCDKYAKDGNRGNFPHPWQRIMDVTNLDSLGKAY